MKVLNKNFLRRSLPRLGGLFLLCSLIVYLPSALCSEPPIIAGKTQMTCGEQQVLSIMNYQTGDTYTWTIESGGGSLSASTGERVTYTAPGSNPNCANNPTIVVSRNGQAVGSFQVAINAVTGNQRAYMEVDDWDTPNLCDGTPRMCRSATCKAYCLRWRYYRCDGLFLQEYTCDVWEACDPNISNRCLDDICEPTSYSYFPIQWCLDGCEGSKEPGTTEDVRTDAMKAAGCCPEVLLLGYEPKPAVPGDVDEGREPRDNAPICPVDDVGNPISINSY